MELLNDTNTSLKLKVEAMNRKYATSLENNDLIDAITEQLTFVEV